MNRQQFIIFKKEADRISSALGLKDWDITISLESIEDSPPVMADANCDYEGRGAHIRVNKDFEFSGTDEIKRTARHECIHILLAEFAHLARFRYITPPDLTVAEERICTVLEKIL